MMRRMTCWRSKGFGITSIAPFPPGILDQSRSSVSGHEDHEALWRQPLDPPKSLDSVHSRHPNIHQNSGWPTLLDALDSFEPGVGHVDPISRRGKNVSQSRDHALVVVDHQESCPDFSSSHASASLADSAGGKVM